jgi:coenzyme F420-reducing hydrogenase beta subunit
MNGWAAILPLLGVVIGAAIQYWTSRAAESRKQLQLLRSQSYVDYLRAVTKSAHASSPDSGRLARAEAADAKARMAVYGTPKAIAALARFEEIGPVLDSPRSKGVFTALVTAMRDGESPSQTDLELVLFGK